MEKQLVEMISAAEKIDDTDQARDWLKLLFKTLGKKKILNKYTWAQWLRYIIGYNFLGTHAPPQEWPYQVFCAPLDLKTPIDWMNRCALWLTNVDEFNTKFQRVLREAENSISTLNEAADEERRLFDRVWQGNSRDINGKEEEIAGSRPFIDILRRWNSCTPAINYFNNQQQFASSERGGGFILYDGSNAWGIDPGYDFVNSYLERGWGLKHLKGLFISHAHDDHTADLERLLSVWFKCEKLVGVSDDTPVHKLKIFCSANTKEKYRRLFAISGHHILDFIPGKDFSVPTSPLHVFTFPVVHKEIPYDYDDISLSSGFRFVLSKEKTYTFSYSGDTSYFEDLPDFLNNTDTVLLNMGTPKESSDKHLGFLGCSMVISKLYKKGRIFLISEWMRECYGKRVEITQRIAKLAATTGGHNYNDLLSHVIPADLYLRILLDSPNRLIFDHKDGYSAEMINCSLIRECRRDGKTSLCLGGY